jgi:hypothetical protein
MPKKKATPKPKKAAAPPAKPPVNLKLPDDDEAPEESGKERVDAIKLERLSIEEPVKW